MRVQATRLRTPARPKQSRTAAGVETSSLKGKKCSITVMLVEYKNLSIGRIEKLGTVHIVEISSTNVDTGKTTRKKIVRIDSMIMNNSQATPDKDELSIWSKTSQIEIGAYHSTSMKLKIVNLNRQKKMRSPQHSRVLL